MTFQPPYRPSGRSAWLGKDLVQTEDWIVRLSPAEEMIWSKAFIQERERFDGADVLHLLRETGPSLDWPRLLMRFGDYWRVLFSHIILFGFVYPDKRQNVPAWVMEELTRRLSVSRPNLQSDVCYGTLLSREQYLHDIERWKYRDSREAPDGRPFPVRSTGTVRLGD